MRPTVALLLTLLPLPACRTESPAVTGTATYQERIALPKDAVFEAALVDVSRAGAPGSVIGMVLAGGPGEPPIPFRIPFDPDRIDSSHRYVIRARLTGDGRVLFLTDRAYPVLTHGAGREVRVTLAPVTVATSLPASFTGDLPCADCPGIRYQLNLFPDSVFHLRTVHLGRGDGAVSDDIGRWTLEDRGSRLVLRGARAAPVMFAAVGAGLLRKLDVTGRPIDSALSYELRRAAKLEPLEPRLRLRGMYRHMADAGIFTECITGRRLPVAEAEDNAALQAEYLKALAQPGDELLVQLEGRIALRPKAEGPDTVPTLVVERFLRIRRGERCS